MIRTDGRFKYWYRLPTALLDQKLPDTYGLEKSDFFRYLQTRTDLNAEIKPTENLTDMPLGMYKNKGNRKLVSKLYSCIQSNKKHSTNTIQFKREEECGLVITEEDWLYMCSVHFRSLERILLEEFDEIFYNAQVKKCADGLCWRDCAERLAGHFHIFWGWPVIQSYWQGVTRAIQKICGVEIDPPFLQAIWETDGLSA